MKAFLLAAGLGTRLRPLTDTIPKCLVPIDGKPLLQIWLDLCQEHRVTEVLVNTHHLPHLVREYFEVNGCKAYADKNKAEELNLSTYRHGATRIYLTYEPVLLGSAGTILANREFVDNEKDFFILYGDNLTNANLSELIRFHRSHDELFTMGLFKTDRPTCCGIAELNGDGKIISFEEKPKSPKTNLAAAGVYAASPKIFNFFPNDHREDYLKPLDLGFHILPKVVGHMYGHVIDDYLLDIGDMESYQKAREEWPRISRLS